MLKGGRSLKLSVLGLMLSALIALPSFSFAKPTIRSVSPNSITRGDSKIIKIKGKNLDDGNWDSIIFAPKGQNISKSTEDTIWPAFGGSYGGITPTTITATLSTSACDMPGRYDLYLVKEQMGKNESYSYKAMAKKRNALSVKKGKNESKISKVKPKRLAKGGMAKVTITGKNLDAGKGGSYSLWIYNEFKKKGEKEHETTASGSATSNTNKKIIADVTVYADAKKGKSNLSLMSYGGKSNVCGEKKNAFTIGKNKLKVTKVSPSQVDNTGSKDITISGKKLKGVRYVRLTNDQYSYKYLDASTIKTNSKNKIVASFPVTTTTTLGDYNLEVRGPDGRDSATKAVVISNTVQ